MDDAARLSGPGGYCSPRVLRASQLKRRDFKVWLLWMTRRALFARPYQLHSLPLQLGFHEFNRKGHAHDLVLGFLIRRRLELRPSCVPCVCACAWKADQGGRGHERLNGDLHPPVCRVQLWRPEQASTRRRSGQDTVIFILLSNTKARCMTTCVKVLQSKSKAKSMDQSQARIKPFRPKSEPVIGPCFLLWLCSVTL